MSQAIQINNQHDGSLIRPTNEDNYKYVIGNKTTASDPSELCAFTVNSNKVGVLRLKDGVLCFEGDCNKSAEVFFEEIIKRYSRFMREGTEDDKNTDNAKDKA